MEQFFCNRHHHHHHNGQSVGMLHANAGLIRATGLAKFLRVTPVEPQQLVWIHEGMELEYNVESNTKWNII